MIRFRPVQFECDILGYGVQEVSVGEILQDNVDYMKVKTYIYLTLVYLSSSL